MNHFFFVDRTNMMKYIGQWMICLVAMMMLSSCELLMDIFCNDTVDTTVLNTSQGKPKSSTVGQPSYSKSQQKKREQLMKEGKCPTCEGMGKTPDGKFDCTACKGTGKYQENSTE